MLLTEFTRLHQEFVKKHGIEDWFLRVPAHTTDCTGQRGQWLLKQLPKIYKPNMKVIDLCGGHGEYGAYLQAVEGYKFDYTCLDNNEKRIAVALEYFSLFGLEGKFIVHDVNNLLPFSEEMFDLAMCFAWCQNKINCHKFFREVHRILKPNGSFMMNMCSLVGFKPPYVIAYAKSDLKALLETCRFPTILIDEICNGSEYGVWVRKG